MIYRYNSKPNTVFLKCIIVITNGVVVVVFIMTMVIVIIVVLSVVVNCVLAYCHSESCWAGSLCDNLQNGRLFYFSM